MCHGFAKFDNLAWEDAVTALEDNTARLETGRPVEDARTAAYKQQSRAGFHPLRLTALSTMLAIVLTLLPAASNGHPITRHHRPSSTKRSTVTIHYQYFDMLAIVSLTSDEIRSRKYLAHKFSGADMRRLYALLRRSGTVEPFPPNTVSLVIGPNPYGPATLVGKLGNVKLGTREYKLSSQQFADVKAFVNARAMLSFPKAVQADLRRHGVKPVNSAKQR
jgi:hypothetical protein